MAIWYGNITLSSDISICITCCIPALSIVFGLSPCMPLLCFCLVVRLLFQFLCEFLIQGGEVFATPLGKSSFLPLGKGSLHTVFLHVPRLVSLILVIAHVLVCEI